MVTPIQMHDVALVLDIAIDTLSILGLTLLLIPLSCVVKDWGHRSPSGYEPFCSLAFGLAAEHQSPLAGGGAGIYFHLSSATNAPQRTDPLHRVDWSTLVIYFLVPLYLPTLELGQMSRDPLLCPPQMRNGGLPLAHLSPSNASPLDAPRWLLPSQRTPDCMEGALCSVILANHGAIQDNLMIALRLEVIAQNAELARTSR
jgi:hypothetical protein